MIDPFEACYPLLLEVEHGPLLVTIRLIPVGGRIYPQITQQVAVQVISVINVHGDRPKRVNIQYALKHLIKPQRLKDAILAMQWALQNDPDAAEEDALVVGRIIDLIQFGSTW